MDGITIREILDSVMRGQIRIPAFQRGFVWEPDRVAYLMDSIYKGFPFGSVLFWRTREVLKCERDLGPFKLPFPMEDYPVDYVLDGQQRITSLFGVFQTSLEVERPEVWRDIYCDLRADKGTQDAQFVALPADEVEEGRHFPLKTLFDTVSYRAATKALDDDTAKKIDALQSIFKEVRIPLQIFKTEEKDKVAIIFERINRQGVPLDILQLLTAWTWSEDFQLPKQFADLADQLAPFGFKDVGADSNLLLRCCSAILGADASPDSLMKLNGRLVRERFSSVVNGVKGAVDYLRTNFHAHSLDALPFATLLVPLSVFFAIEGDREVHYNNDQRKIIKRWFWRTCFTKRYGSAVLRYLNNDIEEMRKVREGKPSTLGGFPASISERFFLDNAFTIGTANTSTFILALAQTRPLSFVSGASIDLSEKLKRANRAEFHHLMPKAFLTETRQSDKANPECLCNFAFMARTDNRDLGGVAPSIYRSKMPARVDGILERALTPASLFSDKYEPFLQERGELLRKHAEDLCK